MTLVEAEGVVRRAPGSTTQNQLVGALRALEHSDTHSADLNDPLTLEQGARLSRVSPQPRELLGVIGDGGLGS